MTRWDKEESKDSQSRQKNHFGTYGSMLNSFGSVCRFSHSHLSHFVATKAASRLLMWCISILTSWRAETKKSQKISKIAKKSIWHLAIWRNWWCERFMAYVLKDAKIEWRSVKFRINLWGHRFSKNANQKFKGFLPYPLINFQGTGQKSFKFLVGILVETMTS